MSCDLPGHGPVTRSRQLRSSVTNTVEDLVRGTFGILSLMSGLVMGASPVAAQHAPPVDGFGSAGSGQPTALAPIQEAADSVALMKGALERLRIETAQEGHRARNAVVGGLIGGVTGIVACTVISNIAKDPGTGFSTCTTKGYLAFGLGGAGLGAVIGSLFK